MPLPEKDAPRPSSVAPPEVWRPAHLAARALIGPVESFLKIQAASGILLLVAAVVAMVWANSPFQETYHHLWHTPVSFGFGEHSYGSTLHFLINEGLMVIFFFVVGLEIRREMHAGELSDLKRASLPIAAAVGGMAVPALVYAGLNWTNPEAMSGWGVPMATDIAFAVGILALLGKRVPAALRILLLALAIIDDIGAILVIAIFYSSGVQLQGFVLAAGALVFVAALKRSGVRNPWLYVPAGALLWLGLLRGGVHPTIGGVILGLMTPARPWFGGEAFLNEAQAAIERFEHHRRAGHDGHHLAHDLQDLDKARREALPPVVRLETKLNPYVAFLIMPLFALANAGVSVGEVALDAPGATMVLVGIGAGLCLGKPLGIVLASVLAVKLGVSSFPRGVDTKGLLVVGLVGGIGFTMALFIANLAFTSPEQLGVAKLAVLIGSFAAGVLGLVYGALVLPKELPEGVAQTATEAERSTDA